MRKNKGRFPYLPPVSAILAALQLGASALIVAASLAADLPTPTREICLAFGCALAVEAGMHFRRTLIDDLHWRWRRR
jgi:hypothetical protein